MYGCQEVNESSEKGMEVVDLSEVTETMGQGITSLEGEELRSVDEHERLDTLVSAFKKLPAPEIQRLGVELDDDAPIIPGSQRALDLMEAWKQRQKELKEAVENMIKPVEYMASLLRHIQIDNSTSLPPTGEKLSGMSWSRLEALEELEGVVDDIDNARDLHTIGGWRILASLLAADRQAGGGVLTPAERAGVAYVMGTATKNSYDFQLWALEELMGADQDLSTGQDKGTVLSGLVHLLTHGTDVERRRSLYAIASITRGNQEVQTALQLPPATGAGETTGTYVDFNAILYGLASDAVSFDLNRKLWTFIADMVEEAAYIQASRAEMVAEAVQQGADVDDVIAQLRALKPLGRTFCSAQWRQKLLSAVLKGIDRLTALRASDEKGAEFSVIRATVDSELTAMAAVTDACGTGDNTPYFSDADKALVRTAVKGVEHWTEDAFGDLREKAQAVLLVLD